MGKFILYFIILFIFIYLITGGTESNSEDKDKLIGIAILSGIFALLGAITT